MIAKLRSDDGLAMVTAILAMMIVAAVTAAGFEMSTHDLNQSAGDRRRVQAIHAAEAGVDRFVTYLSTAPITGTACSLPTETLPTTPSSSFTVTATFYANLDDDTPLPCPPSTVPGAVLVHSVGASAGVTRTMEAQYGLASTPGGSPLFPGAVYADGSATFGGHAALNGNPYGADLYSNGDVSLQGGGTIYGNAEAQGTLSLGGGTDLKQNATSKLQLSLSGGSVVRGHGRSSTADITSTGSSTIYGNAYYCTGSAPGGVGGSPIEECNAALPTSQSWNTVAFTYTPSNWYGYTIQTYNDPNACTNAKSFIEGISSGNYVVRINSTCSLSWGSQDTINVNGNLAIISDGSLSMNSQATFAATSAQNLYLMFNISTARPCSSTGIRFNAQSSIGPLLNVLLYTPCAVSFGAQSMAFSGQIISGSVSFGAGSNITTVAMVIPGPNPTGFQQSMRYRREVI